MWYVHSLNFLNYSMNRSKVLLLSAIVPAILFFTAPVKAGDFPDNERMRHVEQLYTLGFLEAFTINTGESIQELITELTADQNEPVYGRIVLDAFDREDMQVIIKQSLRRSYQEEHARASITHLSKPDIASLMKKLYDSDTDFDDEELLSDFQDFALEVETNPEAWEERIDIIASILNRSQTTRITVQTLEDFLTIVVFAINQTNDEDDRLTDREVNELIISLRNNFRQFFDNMMLFITLYSTREAEIEVLQKHADFLETAHGRWYIRAYNSAVLNSFGEISEKVAVDLADWALSQEEQVLE